VAQNVPIAVAGSPYGVDPDPGEIGTLHANAGLVVLKRDRSAGASVEAPSTLGKLTHFRAPGRGDAMWSGACVYDVPGVSPSFSEYDTDNAYAGDDGLTYSITGGVMKSGDRLAVQEPSSTRHARNAAVFDSAPAAAVFQGFANLRWSGMMAGFRPVIAPRPLHSNFNPGQMGTKELHKATQYKPVPPMGSLVDYFDSSDKAL